MRSVKQPSVREVKVAGRVFFPLTFAVYVNGQDET